MIIRQTAYLSVIMLVLSGCGGTGQGQGNAGALSAANLQGVALDGYLAGAECYLDVNNNYQQDAIEPSAITDADGYYSRNPLTDVDYCAANATAEQATHCLKTFVTGNQLPIRCQNGYDVISEQPYSGTLSTLVNVNAGVDITDVVISPLTTLYANTSSEIERTKLSSALGLANQAAASVDYLQSKDTQLVGLALKVQKIAEVLAEPIKTTHTNISTDEAGVDSVGQVYAALTDYMVNNQSSNLDELLTNEVKLKTILIDAEQKFKTAQSANTNDVFTANVGDALLDKAVLRAAQINVLVDDLCGSSASTLTAAQINGCSRATEVVTQKIREELADVNPQTDTSIDTAVSCFLTDSCSAVIAALQQDNFDVGGLAKNDFSDPMLAAEQAALPMDAGIFADVANKSLLVNDPDNSVIEKQKHARLEMYFEAGSINTKGPLTACVRYLEGAAAANPTTATTLENGNTLGKQVSGDWEIIGSGYSMLVKLKIAEQSKSYQAILKSAGDNSSNKKVYRFDFDGGLQDWLSTSGLVSATEIPATDAECKNRFNSVTE